MIHFAQESEIKKGAVIKVLGIGGAGGNTVNSIIESGCENIECVVANTDAQALEHSKAAHKVQIGVKATKGLGTGANPSLGQRSAQEDLDKLLQVVEDADIVFLTGGLGGGTGSGGLPVVARALKEKNILSIAVVTKPFTFEGKRRMAVAEAALEQLRQSVDTLIVIPNQRLLDVVEQNVSMLDAFAMINQVLSHSVKGISDIITKPGHINVDFADVRTIMKDMGLAVLGTGKASGADRARIAAEQAISSPLLENMSIDGAKGVLLNITGGPSLGLHEISQAASIIYERADQDANIILGSVIDTSLGNDVHVTIIATGFACESKEQAHPEIVLAQEQGATEMKKAEEVKQQAEQLVAELMAAQEAAKKEQQRIIEEQELAAAIAAEQAELMAAKRAEDELVIQEKEAEVDVDINDLDVPAFMRKNGEVERN